jgi:predicted MPP superfamily phosphohydrolase
MLIDEVAKERKVVKVQGEHNHAEHDENDPKSGDIIEDEKEPAARLKSLTIDQDSVQKTEQTQGHRYLARYLIPRVHC